MMRIYQPNNKSKIGLSTIENIPTIHTVNILHQIFQFYTEKMKTNKRLISYFAITSYHTKLKDRPFIVGMFSAE